MDNIKMDLTEIGCGGVDRIVLVQDREKWRAVVNAVMNLRIPRNVWKFASDCIHMASAVVLSSI
jgi:hypothetical protein